MSRRRLGASWALCCLLAAAGCRAGRPVPSGRGGNPRETQPSPPNAVGRGIEVVWREKAGKAGIRRVLEAKAEIGRLDPSARSSAMEKASGTLYRNGEPAATFRAGKVTADEDDRLVIATGGVLLKSVNPAGVTVTADKVTWQADKNRVIVEGRARLTQDSDRGPTPRMEFGPFPRITLDTQLQNFSIP